MHLRRFLVVLVIITMESPVVLLEVLTGIQAEIRVVDTTTRIVEAKVVVTAMHHIHHKGVGHHMLAPVCLQMVPEDLLAGTELVLKVIPKVVNMEILLLAGVQTKWVVVEINNMAGSSKACLSVLNRNEDPFYLGVEFCGVVSNFICLSVCLLGYINVVIQNCLLHLPSFICNHFDKIKIKKKS